MEEQPQDGGAEINEAADKDGSTSSKVDATDSKEKIVFPPAATWYKTNATASRDDMWAYLAGQSIVLVTPKVTHTRIIKPDMPARCGDASTSFNSPVDQNIGSTSRIWPNFEVFGFQRENYSCLSFCQSAWDFLPVKGSPLVTGCKEGYVRIWNVTTGVCELYYDLHKSKDKSTAVTCLDWSTYDPKVIYSMDEEGTLVSMYLPKLKLKSTSFGKIYPTSLHASPHEANIVAFGTKGGVIFIALTDPKGKSSVRILHKVRHDEEIVATLWCPKLGWRMNRSESSNTNEVTGAILASSIQSSKSPTIRLWSRKAEDRGIYHVWEKEKHGKPFRNFSPLLWATDPNSGLPLLVTSSRQGKLISYSQDSVISDVIHDIHQHSSIFGLVQCGDIIWSTSYEPVIIGFNLRTMLVCCVVPTFKGVCSIAPSPSVGSLLAIGGADACIRVVDFVPDYPEKSSVKAPHISNRLRSKIMALSWHPKKDNLLGFGTDDGMLGTFEVRDNHKQTMLFDRRVSGVVYAVDWGPSVFSKDYKPKEASNNETQKDFAASLSLYACGGNSVFLIHPSKANNPLINVSEIINSTNPQSAKISGLESVSTALTVVSKASDIRWSPDFSLLAVGYNDGRVELFAPPFLQLKCWIKCHSRAIQFLSWRQNDFIQAQLTPEYKCRWFATTSNDATVRLFNLESIFERSFLESDTEEPKLLITSQAKLCSPSELRVISCAWSPHDPNLLVTVSYDSTAIIWNITDGVVGKPIARYFGHGHRLVACAFHPKNKYEVISASDELMYDCAVHVWDYRLHPYSDHLPNGSGSKCSEKVNPIHIKSKDQNDLEEPGDPQCGGGEDIVTKRNSVKDAAARLHVSDKAVVKCIDNNKASSGGKSRGGRIRSLLPSTANTFMNAKFTLETEFRYLINPNSREKESSTSAALPNGQSKELSRPGLVDEIPKDDNDESNDDEEESSDGKVDKAMVHLGILGNFGQCVDLMKAECEFHASRGNWEKGCLLASWMGDTDFIEKAIDEGYVTESIVMLAKSMSKPVFKKACEKFAQKLVLQDDVLKAVTYLLQGGWKNEAIDLLVEHKLYRDAIALMVTNPSKADASRKVEIINKWLQQLVQDGNFEVAAKVYFSMGQQNDALAVIEKRDLPYAWKAGMFLADQCGDEKKLKMLGFNYCVDCIMKGCHEEAKQAITKYSRLKWLLPIVLAHETIFNMSNKKRDAVNSSQKINHVESFNEIMANILDLEELKKDAVLDTLKETIVISIAQNKNDAQVILLKSLLMKLLGDPTSESSSLQEDYYKLCEVWLKEKDSHLFSTYMDAFHSQSLT